jgi:uncharacterized protein (TIGR03435 family)
MVVDRVWACSTAPNWGYFLVGDHLPSKTRKAIAARICENLHHAGPSFCGLERTRMQRATIIRARTASLGPRQCQVLILGIAVSLLTSPLLKAQTTVAPQDTRLAFDVASVRQNLAGEDAQGADSPHVNFPIGSDDAYYDTGGVFSATNLPLTSYLIFAFKITNNNRQALLDSVPDWVKTDHYNIEARTELANASKDQMRLMMQSLLRDRFNLAVHRETRTVKVYAAVLNDLGRMGPQLRAHAPGAPCPEDIPNPSPMSAETKSQFNFDALGFPEVCGRFVNAIPSKIPHHRRFGGGGLSMLRIVASFAGVGNLDRPVVDRTGLAGQFDFVLDFLPDPPPGQQASPDAEGPSFIAAVQLQLGLKLVTERAPMEFVIVDRIEKPTPN